jgi:hypothetical protein
MLMKTNQQWGYLAPEIEVIITAVEQGFFTSPDIEDWEEDDEDHGGAAE